MSKKKSTLRFFVILFVVLASLGSIVFGGYLILDKVVVPKYFSEYGINGMGDLVGLMRTLYSLPNESEIITNAYSASDLKSATKRLRDANYPIDEDGTFNFEDFNNGQKGDGGISLTDKELAAILNKLMESTEFSEILPNLNYIDTLNINLCELDITPEEIDEEYSKTKARIKAILKINTEEVRQQMANEMQIPIFLLNMIFPKQLYITCEYNVEIDNSGEDIVWNISDGSLTINGSDQKKSEIFLNLLISFVFNQEENMTIDKLIENFGNILSQGTDLFGEIEFATGLGPYGKNNGIHFVEVTP